MDTIRKIIIGGVLSAPIAFATPAFAKLSQSEILLKQKLEQKYQDSSLTSQEIELLQILTEAEIRDRKDSRTDMYVIGGAAGLAVVGAVSAISCVYGFLPGCVVAEKEAEVLLVVP